MALAKSGENSRFFIELFLSTRSHGSQKRRGDARLALKARTRTEKKISVQGHDKRF